MSAGKRTGVRSAAQNAMNGWTGLLTPESGKKWWTAWLQFANLRHPNAFSEQRV